MLMEIKPKNHLVSKAYLRVKHSIIFAHLRHYEQVKRLVELYLSLESEPKDDKTEIKKLYRRHFKQFGIIIN